MFITPFLLLPYLQNISDLIVTIVAQLYEGVMIILSTLFMLETLGHFQVAPLSMTKLGSESRPPKS